MTIHKVLRSFSDQEDNMKVYRKTVHLYFGDEANDRTKELRGSKNKHGAPIIKALTRAELLRLAEKHNIEVEDKMKVGELNKKIEGVLNGDKG